MPSSSCLFLLLFLTAMLVIPVSADLPSVIVSDVRMTPQVLMPGDQGLLSITLTNTASGSVKTESSGSSSGTGSTVSTSTEINPVIDLVTLDGGRDIRVLGGDRQYQGELGPRQSITLPFLIEAPSYAGVFFPVLIVRLDEGDEGGKRHLEFEAPEAVPVDPAWPALLAEATEGGTESEAGKKRA